MARTVRRVAVVGANVVSLAEYAGPVGTMGRTRSAPGVRSRFPRLTGRRGGQPARRYVPATLLGPCPVPVDEARYASNQVGVPDGDEFGVSAPGRRECPVRRQPLQMCTIARQTAEPGRAPAPGPGRPARHDRGHAALYCTVPTASDTTMRVVGWARMAVPLINLWFPCSGGCVTGPK